MAKEPKGKKTDGIVDNVVFSFMPVLLVLLICLGMLCFNKTESVKTILFQMVTGGDMILCSFAVLLPSFSRFTRERSTEGYALLIIGIAEVVLYAIFKVFSGSENCNLILIIAVSVVFMLLSVGISYRINRERAEEARQAEEPVEQIVNAEEVAK